MRRDRLPTTVGNQIDRKVRSGRQEQGVTVGVVDQVEWGSVVRVCLVGFSRYVLYFPAEFAISNFRKFLSFCFALEDVPV